MSLKTICPHCDLELTVSDAMLGKRVKCKECGDPFTARPADEDDDVDEPSSRKKQGAPVMLLAIIGIVAVLLLAAGVGAFLAFTKTGVIVNPPPPVVNAPDRPLSVPPGKKDAPAGWPECHEVEGRYRVKFPAMAMRKIQPHKGPKGENFDLVVYTCEDDTEPLGFMAAHKPVPDKKGTLTVDYILDEGFSNKRLRPKGGIEKSRKPITYQGFPGREMILDFPDKGTQGIGRLILAEDRIILLVASGPDVAPDSIQAKTFFESLKID